MKRLPTALHADGHAGMAAVRPRNGRRVGGAALVLYLLMGCAGQEAYRSANAHLEKGETDAGLAMLKQAMGEAPDNTAYRLAYYAQRDRMRDTALRDVDLALEMGNFPAAEAALARARTQDALHPRVAEGPERIEAARRLYKALDRAETLAREGKLDAAVSATRQVLAEVPTQRRANQLLRQLQRQQTDASGKELGLYPKLREGFKKPVTLSLANATLLQVFEALKQASGLNFVFDRDVRNDQRVTLSVSNKSVEDVLRLMLVTNQLERRVLDEDTLLIYPNSPQKAREYQELVVRSFYLANADINKAATLVKSIAKARDVFVDDKLNLLIVRDTAEVVRLTERLLANQDLADPEVVLELEVMEVSTNRLTEMGIRWPDSVSASISGAAGIPGSVTLPEFRNRNESMVQLQFNDPLIAAQLRGQKGDANLLANPRIRVRNRQTAKVLIGERVPVITTSATPNVGTYESVNYLDVGLKLEIEPTVSLDDEVAMKLALEVSNILDTVTRVSGTQVYRLGTRNASTQLRVRDGETQILAGLIQRDERKSNAGIPYASEIPLLGYLFGATSDNATKTEIVLLITPRIVRNINMPGPGQIEFLSGTEASTGGAPIQLNPAVPAPGAVAPAPIPGAMPPRPVAPAPYPPAPGYPQAYPPTPPQGALPLSGLVTPPLIPTSPNETKSTP